MHIKIHGEIIDRSISTIMNMYKNIQQHYKEIKERVIITKKKSKTTEKYPFNLI